MRQRIETRPKVVLQAGIVCAVTFLKGRETGAARRRGGSSGGGCVGGGCS